MKHVPMALLAVVMGVLMVLSILSCGGGGGQDTAPVADAGPDQSVPKGATVSLDGSGSSDPDGTPITYSWSFDSMPQGSAAALSDKASVSPTFTADLEGIYVLSLVVSDGWLDSAPDTVTVTAGSAPVADAGLDQSVPTGGAVSLDGSGSSDPDGAPITYSWSFDSMPQGSAAALSDQASVSPTFTADLDGTYVLSLVVNDGFQESSPDTVKVKAMSPVAGMAIIPTGCFEMGDAFDEGTSDELPVHEVCITGFHMDVHEVTNAEYKACMDAGSCTSLVNTSSKTRPLYYSNALYDDFPVIYVTWFQATDYCSWQAGKRLPTEAEWEYAARGGLSGNRYPWGDAISGADANYWGSGYPLDDDTSQVGHYAPNGYGLYDMAGNVQEWVNDWWSDLYYGESPTNDPQGPSTGDFRVLRGGAWDEASSALRVSARVVKQPTKYSNNQGFRCAQD